MSLDRPRRRLGVSLTALEGRALCALASFEPISGTLTLDAAEAPNRTIKLSVAASAPLLRVNTTTAGISGAEDGLDVALVRRIEVHGSEGSDNLDLRGVGTYQFSGLDGRVTIHGMGGNDTIVGSYYDDSIYGGDGIDEIHGDYGDDRLFGEAGDDFLMGDPQTLLAFADTLDGGAGHDALSGANGNDVLIGGAGRDRFEGNGGRDWFVGVKPIDTVYDFNRGDGDRKRKRL